MLKIHIRTVASFHDCVKLCFEYNNDEGVRFDAIGGCHYAMFDKTTKDCALHDILTAIQTNNADYVSFELVGSETASITTTPLTTGMF